MTSVGIEQTKLKKSIDALSKSVKNGTAVLINSLKIRGIRGASFPEA